MKEKIIIALFSLALASCASVRPQNASDYDRELVAPDETPNFVLVGKQVYEEPLLGVGLDYENKQYPTDNINVYVYPVDVVSWEDTDSVISSEMDDVLEEIDLAIQYGSYKSRSEQVLEDFSFTHDGKEFRGKKASFSLVTPSEVMLYSNSYVFVSKDKYIKFRTSFDSRATVKWDGDSAVTEILPAIEVPDESQYMKALREEHQRQIQQALMNALLQAVKEAQ